LTAGQRRKLFLNRIRHSELARSLKVIPGVLPYRALRASNTPLLIDIQTRMGMGAILSLALRLHNWAALQRADLAVTSTSPLYSDGDDMLSRYFERPAAVSRRPMSHLAREWIFRNEAPQHFALGEASDLFVRLFTPNTRLLALLDTAADGTSAFDLSIHFRATDKYLETGLVDHESILATAGPYLAQASRVFLATDDAGFALTIRQRWPGIRFVSYDLGEVEAGKARHFSGLSAQDKASEALVNMFLLARAPVCVRTMSYLSSFARIINPDLQTITVNRRIDAMTPFPERQILELEA
jgi:hypothetical protein